MQATKSKALKMVLGWMLRCIRRGCWVGGLCYRVFVLRVLPHGLPLSVRATMTFPAVEVARDSETIAAVQAGDISSINQLFRLKKAGPFDMLTNGDSLLHV